MFLFFVCPVRGPVLAQYPEHKTEWKRGRLWQSNDCVIMIVTFTDPSARVAQGYIGKVIKNCMTQFFDRAQGVTLIVVWIIQEITLKLRKNVHKSRELLYRAQAWLQRKSWAQNLMRMCHPSDVIRVIRGIPRSAQGRGHFRHFLRECRGFHYSLLNF